MNSSGAEKGTRLIKKKKSKDKLALNQFKSENRNKVKWNMTVESFMDQNIFSNNCVHK